MIFRARAIRDRERDDGHDAHLLLNFFCLAFDVFDLLIHSFPRVCIQISFA